MTSDPSELRRDVAASLGARRDLGPDYDDQIAAGLAERMEHLVAARVADHRAAAVLAQQGSVEERSGRTRQFVLGVVSLGAGIPITAISATQVHPSVVGVVVSWAGILGVNAVHAWSLRRR